MPTSRRLSACPVSPAASRSGSIAQRQKSRTIRSSWSTVVIRRAAKPVGHGGGSGATPSPRCGYAGGRPARGPAEGEPTVEEVRHDVVRDRRRLADGDIPHERGVREKLLFVGHPLAEVVDGGVPLGEGDRRALSKTSPRRSSSKCGPSATTGSALMRSAPRGSGRARAARRRPRRASGRRGRRHRRVPPSGPVPASRGPPELDGPDPARARTAR